MVRSAFVDSASSCGLCADAGDEYLKTVILALIVQGSIGGTVIDPGSPEARNEFVRVVTGMESELIGEYDQLVAVLGEITPETREHMFMLKEVVKKLQKKGV